MRPTVHDIAEAAGVSLATVDRVLNRRPGVRAQTAERVEAAIARLGYVRDIAAANLAKSRVYSFVFLVPGGSNPFMHAIAAELKAAAMRGVSERTTIAVQSVPPFDAAALVRALDGIDPDTVSGVALVAVDAPDVARAIARLARAGVPVVTLVSDFPDTGRVHYAGIDNAAAGRTAASLLGNFVGRRSGKIAVLAGSLLLRDHVERHDGFRAVLAADFPGLELLPVIEGRDDADVTLAVMRQRLSDTPDLVGIYSLGAGNAGLAESLKRSGRAGEITVIAHELDNDSRAALESGIFDAVIAQDPAHEVRSAVRVLKARADSRAIVPSQERIRIEIYLKHNLSPCPEVGGNDNEEAEGSDVSRA